MGVCNNLTRRCLLSSNPTPPCGFCCCSFLSGIRVPDFCGTPGMKLICDGLAAAMKPLDAILKQIFPGLDDRVREFVLNLLSQNRPVSCALKHVHGVREGQCHKEGCESRNFNTDLVCGGCRSEVHTCLAYMQLTSMLVCRALYAFMFSACSRLYDLMTTSHKGASKL
jgi:hypothetical protein